GHRPGDLRAAARPLPLRLAEDFPRGAHVARHRARRHAPVQGPFGRPRRDPQAAGGPRAALCPRRRDHRHLGQIREAEPGRTEKGDRMISFETQPDRYNHWKLAYDGPLAMLTLDVAEDKGIVPGYKLKLNS